MNKPHTHAAILHAIAEGKRVEYRHCSNKWTAADHNTILQRILYEATATFRENEFRVAPETVDINGVKCTKPKGKDDPYPKNAWVVNVVLRNGAGCTLEQATFIYTGEPDARTLFTALAQPLRDVL